MYDTLLIQSERLRRMPFISMERLKVSCAEHMEILEALRSRDFEYAKGVLTHHLHNTEEAATNASILMRQAEQN